MKSVFYGIGVGPGDPELMTYKAVRIIEACEVLVIPDSGGANLNAYEIALQAMPNIEQKEKIHLKMPMSRDEQVLKLARKSAAEEIIRQLDQGKDVVFLTLGDPSIYSTFIYLRPLIIEKGYTVDTVPGITSFCAAAACLGISLGDGKENIHIIAGSYGEIDASLSLKGTKIFMKTGRAGKCLLNTLREKELLNQTALVQNCGMSGEEVINNLAENPQGELAEEINLDEYFSIFIVKEQA